LLGELRSSTTTGPLRDRLDEVASTIDGHLPAAADVYDEWMRFRAAVWPAYEALAVHLRAAHVPVPSLRPSNHARSVYHVFMGLMCIALAEFLPSHAWLIGTAGSAAAAAWAMESVRRVDTRANTFLMWAFARVAHPSEAHRVNSGTWYATAVFLLAVGGDVVSSVVGLAVIALGDPAAAWIGRRYGRTALARGRSLEGTLGGIAVATVTVLVALTLLHPEISISARVLTAVSASVTGMLAEVGIRRLDDNFTIPLVAAATAALVLGALT
jgi:dolichol kinase